jgi:hypothetical protein
MPTLSYPDGRVALCIAALGKCTPVLRCNLRREPQQKGRAGNYSEHTVAVPDKISEEEMGHEFRGIGWATTTTPPAVLDSALFRV